MRVETLRFGPIEAEESDTITFAAGIPGFEQLQRYIIIKPDEELPFSFLQSVDDGDVAFIVTNPFVFYPEYEFVLSEADQEELGSPTSDDLFVWSIVSVPGDIDAATLNLLAPVVVNKAKRWGKQIILHGTAYKIKHPLVNKETAEAAASKGEPGC